VPGTLITTGARVFQLCRQNGAWFIAQGKVDIFASGKPGTREVPRRHLATFSDNDLIFAAVFCSFSGSAGSKGTGLDQQQELIAVAHPGTKVIYLDDFHFDIFASDPANLRLIEHSVQQWVSSLLKVIPQRPVPKRTVPLAVGEEICLSINCSAAPVINRVLWVRLLSGSAILSGNEDLELHKAEVPLPLCKDTWLLSTRETHMQGVRTCRILEKGWFWRGLGYFHEMILRYLISETVAKIAVNRERLYRRTELDAQVLKAANSNLASAVGLSKRHDTTRPETEVPVSRSVASHVGPDPQSSMELARQVQYSASNVTTHSHTSRSIDPLWEACRVVCHRLGISLRRPPDLPPSVSMIDRLQRLCDSCRLHRRQVRLLGNWWEHDNGPCVAFLVNAEHSGQSEANLRPVALFRKRGNYRLFDPAISETRVVDGRLAKSLHENAFMLYPACTDPLPTPKEFLQPLIQRHRGDLFAILAMAFGGGILSMLVPILTGSFFGKVIPNGYRDEIVQLTFVLVVAALGACAFQITRALSLLRLTGKLDLDTQPLVWSRLLALPVSFFRRFTVGDLADRVQGIDIIRQVLLTDVTTTALAVITSLTSFGLLFYYSWSLALVATGLITLLMAATVVCASFQLKHRSRSLEIQGRISSLVFALVQGLSKLRTCGAEIRSYGIWADKFSEQSRHALHAQRMAGLQASLSAFYIVASELVLFALMGHRFRNHLSLGSFLAFSAAFGQVQAALLTFITLIPDLLLIIPIYKRLHLVLDAPAEADENKVSIQLSGEIGVEDVSFRYEEHGPRILDNISFKVHPGNFVAIVGPSGSGKSTLIRLLLGFETPTSGSIIYDKHNLASLDVKSVRRQIGTVLQNSKPITGDIFRNIVGGTSGDLDAAWEAARIAGIDEEIRAMPMGMHTLIGEGATTFSGGERQRFMIARAVVNRPRIILLDEATSALDNPTQDKVQHCLEKMNATRIVIAHRLSTIRHADIIYVFDNGRIVERGTYEDLCRSGGTFAQMALRQI
jgi:NHLM bacteriocin system ABC transporter ATP-binding protein